MQAIQPVLVHVCVAIRRRALSHPLGLRLMIVVKRAACRPRGAACRSSSSWRLYRHVVTTWRDGGASCAWSWLRAGLSGRTLGATLCRNDLPAAALRGGIRNEPLVFARPVLLLDVPGQLGVARLLCELNSSLRVWAVAPRYARGKSLNVAVAEHSWEKKVARRLLKSCPPQRPESYPQRSR